MTTNKNNNTHAYAETVFDADDYEAETRSLGSFDDKADWETVTTKSSMPEAVARWQPAFRRPNNVGMGEHVAVAARATPDKPDEMGVENRYFHKIIVYVEFALVKDMVKKLCKQLPGYFFWSKDQRNHDHPFSHVVNQVGTQIMQRMMMPGQWILDIYGSPRMSAKFNASQKKARNPKVMHSLVANKCSADFIREVNKWGPRFDEEDNELWRYGHILKQDPEYISMFDVYQLVQTLYYLQLKDLVALLHSPSSRHSGSKDHRKKALALIHSHTKDHGFLNDGEQEYWVKNGIVKQKNVKTNTCYVHPNITPFWFSERKEWYGPDGRGFVWELHMVCDDLWIIEIVAAHTSEEDEDFSLDRDLWMEKFEEGDVDVIQKTAPPAEVKPVRSLMGPNKKAVILNVCNDELFSELRRYAMGRPREGPLGLQLLKEMINKARGLVYPNALFPESKTLACPDEAILDHVFSAFVTDLERETSLLGCLDNMQKMIYDHTAKVTGKKSLASFQSMDMKQVIGLLADAGKDFRGGKKTDVVGVALTGISKLTNNFA